MYSEKEEIIEELSEWIAEDPNHDALSRKVYDSFHKKGVLDHAQVMVIVESYNPILDDLTSPDESELEPMEQLHSNINFSEIEHKQSENSSPINTETIIIIDNHTDINHSENHNGENKHNENNMEDTMANKVVSILVEAVPKSDILLNNVPLSDITDSTTVPVIHGDNAQTNDTKTDIDEPKIWIPKNTDSRLIVLPTHINLIRVDALSIADDKTIVRIEPAIPMSEEESEYLKKRMENRWAQVLVNRAKATGVYPGFSVPSTEYDLWITPLLNEMPSDYVHVMMVYYEEIHKLKLESVQFAKYVISDYSKLTTDLKSKPRTLPIIGAVNFPRTLEGNKYYIRFLRETGYYPVEFPEKRLFEQSVQISRVFLFQKQSQNKDLVNTQDDADSLWDRILSMSVLDVLREEVKLSMPIGYKALNRDFAHKLQRRVLRTLHNYDPSAIDPLTLEDFAYGSIMDGKEPTKEEKQAYSLYTAQRDREIKSYKDKIKRTVGRTKGTDLFFELDNITKKK